MKNILTLILFLALMLGMGSMQGQVQFKLQLLNDGITYQVSLVREATYRPPSNMTSTAQVSIKVPTGGFEVVNLKSLQPNVDWALNASAVAPEEAPLYDYLSFGLINQGTSNLRYESGIELALFSFQNALDCSGEIALMDNKTDPFFPPNSKQKNVGNQITIMGANGDAYTGNLVKSSIPCTSHLTDIRDIDKATLNLKLFPNPSIEKIQIELNWIESSETDVQLSILDFSGRQVHNKIIELQKGINLLTIPVNQLSQGNYYIELRGEDWKLRTEQFVKMDN